MYAGQFRFFLSPHIYKVVDAMTHAVTSTRPKLRYGVGWEVLLEASFTFTI